MPNHNEPVDVSVISGIGEALFQQANSDSENKELPEGLSAQTDLSEETRVNNSEVNALALVYSTDFRKKVASTSQIVTQHESYYGLFNSISPMESVTGAETEQMGQPALSGEYTPSIPSPTAGSIVSTGGMSGGY